MKRRIMPPSKWETWFKWLVVAALAIIVINLFAASTMHAQEITMSPTLGGYAGVTDCDSTSGEPHIWLVAGRSSFDTHMTLLHEMVHYRQFKNYPGGCWEARAKYNSDTHFRMKMETEAYCVDLDFETNMDKREFMLDQLSMKMFQLYGRGEILYVESKQIVHDICNTMRGGESKPPPAPS